MPGNSFYKISDRHGRHRTGVASESLWAVAAVRTASRCFVPASELLKQNPDGGFLVAAHFHHGVRQHEADGDADFVRELANQIGARFQLGQASGKHRDESSMRSDRHAFLRKTTQQSGARYIALAHSADDNIETVLHNLFRGTGPRGIAGIMRHRELAQDRVGKDLVLMRPLLSVRRDSIREALKAIGQDWREDSSNANTDYQRNWIRTQLVPFIQQRYPKVDESIIRTIGLQSQWKFLMDQHSRQWFGSHLISESPISIRRDRDAEPPVVINALQQLWASQSWPQSDMTTDHWKRLASSITSDTPDRYSLPGSIDVLAEGTTLSLTPIE